MVMIVSANGRIRRMWSRSLEGRFSLSQVGDRAALEKGMVSGKFSVLLLDLALPHLHGIGSVPALRDLSPATKIILFAKTPDDREAIKALQVGAKGYCCRDIKAELLVRVVDVARKGEIWVGRKIISGFLEELSSISKLQRNDFPLTRDIHLDRLTPREYQIASLVGDGDSNKEIARQLNISERTVKAHLTAVFQKIGISDRLRLALLLAHGPHNGHLNS